MTQPGSQDDSEHEITVFTHRMVALDSVVKEIAFTTERGDLLDPEHRKRMVDALAADSGAWNGLDPKKLDLRAAARTSLERAARALTRDTPGSRFRVVIEILHGTPDGTPVQLCGSRTELLD